MKFKHGLDGYKELQKGAAQHELPLSEQWQHRASIISIN